MDLSGTSAAVVTGGSSGNGRAICMAFAREGVDVVVADVREAPREGGRPTHEAVETETDASATFVECDVRERADLEEAVDAAEEFGGIGAMVNNAGVLHSGDPLETSEERYDWVMDVNVKGTFLGCQVAGRRMVADDGGSIVNVSSVAGLRGNSELTAYSASKGAVRLMTYAFAGALGPRGVRVNAVHPGPIETEMTTEDSSLLGAEQAAEYAARNPLGRAGVPEDVAEATLYLASEHAAYVNAESLVVDGGAFYST